nr:agroclavine dehydrogenase [Quercus suber]
MTILITGSSGKTASQLARLLAPTHPILVASRTPRADAIYPTVRLDWLDESTYSLPFNHATAKDSPISAVYLVSPDVDEARKKIMTFVKHAVTQGTMRFVLLSAWENPEGGPLMGQAHAELRRMQHADGIEWTVLRPHFFMENFAESYHQASIQHENKIYSAARDGRKPFIAAHDIAAVARVALLREISHNTDHYLTGPQSLSYDDVAQIFSEELDRKIEHVRLSRDAFERLLRDNAGLEPEMAMYMADLDERVACRRGGGEEGEGEKVSDVVRQVTGVAPRTLRDFVREHRAEWEERA